MKVTVETVMDLILVNLLMRMATFVVMNSQVKRMSTVKITLTIADLEPVTYVNVILYLLAPRQMKIIAIVQHAKHNSPDARRVGKDVRMRCTA